MTAIDWSQAPEWAREWRIIGRRDEDQSKWYALWISNSAEDTGGGFAHGRMERAPMFGFRGDPADSLTKRP